MKMIDKLIYLLLAQNSQTSSDIETQTLPFTFKSNGRRLKNYRIYGNTVNEESVGDLVTEGEHSGEYLVPVTVTNGVDTQTTNLYLPEQIKMVGDKAEYVDYKEQKQHRVRKNLLQNMATSQTINGVTFTVNDDGSVSYERISASNSQSDFYIMGTSDSEEQTILHTNTRYIFSGGVSSTAKIRIVGFGIPSGLDVSENVQAYTISSNSGKIILRVKSSEVGSGIFYPMIRLASIEDDTYEPYITDTELDVTLPALPTLSGTNELSVGTTVQPSKIYLQGNISEIETVSAQSLQASPRTLDVMPIDRDEFQINDISEMSVEEIPETDNLETTGDEENAE